MSVSINGFLGGGWYSRARSRVRRSAASCFPKILEKSSFPMVPRTRDDDGRWRTTIDAPDESKNANIVVVEHKHHRSRKVHVFFVIIVWGLGYLVLYGSDECMFYPH